MISKSKIKIQFKTGHYVHSREKRGTANDTVVGSFLFVICVLSCESTRDDETTQTVILYIKMINYVYC